MILEEILLFKLNLTIKNQKHEKLFKISINYTFYTFIWKKNTPDAPEKR